MGKTIILLLIACMLIGTSMCASAPLMALGTDLKGAGLQGGPPGGGRGPPDGQRGPPPSGMPPGGGLPPTTAASG
ncbi:small nuclear ribonucleoprotein-associated protein B-like [Episyrphus balteatus]|uniref:small nuclear ribonucleoprotein-associated protein B-like n=1 Tax=Episyrphus balteatus TaxID=286459 RepID=UPI002486631E|nr:small nuclear ribonucleoprotein-associated protein B-like [Episyrphus balteatus]